MLTWNGCNVILARKSSANGSSLASRYSKRRVDTEYIPASASCLDPYKRKSHKFFSSPYQIDGNDKENYFYDKSVVCQVRSISRKFPKEANSE